MTVTFAPYARLCSDAGMSARAWGAVNSITAAQVRKER